MNEQLGNRESRLPLRGRRIRGESVEHEEDTFRRSLGLFCTCGNKFKSEYSLSLHILKLTKAEGKYKCQICKSQFFVEKFLQKHLQLEHKPMRGKGCIDCGKEFPMGEFFRKHCELAHPQVVKPPPPVSRPTPPSLEQDDSHDSIQFIGIFTAKQADASKQESEPSSSSTSSAALATPIIINTTMMTRSQVKVEPLEDVLENLGVTFPSSTPKQPSKPNSSGTRHPRIFGCVICEKGFTRIYDLQRHLKSSHDAGSSHLPIGCLQCEKVFRTRKDCITHCATFHPPIDLKPRLPLASSSRDSIPVPILTIDEEDDDEDYEYSLDSPPLSPSEKIPFVIYDTASSLQELPSESDMMNSPLDTLVDLHQQDTTKMDLGFYCTCGIKYCYKKRLENHILSFSHLEETQGIQFDFECDVCRQIFPTEPQLKDHTKRSHKMLIVETMEDGGGGGGRGNVGCIHCEFKFDTFVELQQHQEVEHNVKVRKVRQVARPNVRRAVKGNFGGAARSRSRPRSRIGITNLLEENCSHRQVEGREGG